MTDDFFENHETPTIMNVRKWFLLWFCLMDSAQLSIIKVVKDVGNHSKSSASLVDGDRQLRIQLFNRTSTNNIYKSPLFFGWKKLYLLLLVPKGLIINLLTTTTEVPEESTMPATEEPYYYYPYYYTYYDYYDILPLVNGQQNKRPNRRPNRNQGKRKRVRKRPRRRRRKKRPRRRKNPKKNHRRRHHRPPWRAVPKGRYSSRKTKRGYNKEGGHNELATTDSLTNTSLRPRKYHQKSSIFSAMISSVTFVWRKSLELISSLFDTNSHGTRERAI